MAAELDIEDRAQLQRYLQTNFSPAGEFEIVEFEVLAGGVSGRTVRVKLSGGQEWVLKQALAKLRVKADWFSDPRRIHREALGMKVLGELTPPGSIPKLIFDDERHHVLAMEAVPQPHDNWKSMLLAGNVDDKYAIQFGQLLSQIHLQSAARADELSQLFADRSFFESLRVEPYYVYSATQEPRASTFYEKLIADTRSTRTALVHGDFSPKNVLVQEEQIVLLDHEVIHWGDPAFDVGFAMTHFLSKAHHFPQWRSEYVGLARTFYRVYGIMMSKDQGFFKFDAPYVAHTLGCLLARVVGRSPLEYLSQVERDRQHEVVVRLIQDLPEHMPALVNRFEIEIER